MAIYHCSIKTISRSHGRSATASCAYRTGTEITDERTGEHFDYTRKRGIEHVEIMIPNNSPSWANNRNSLWNAVEKTETRKNSTVAREVVSALPHELTKEQHIALAQDFANDLVDRYKVAVDIAIHAPDRGGDDKNHHVHFLMSTRRLEAEGFTKKTRELDDRKTGEVNYIRKSWQDFTNQHLARANVKDRIDCRSNKERGLEQVPTQHMGVHATQIERKGEPTRIGEKNRNIQSWNRDLYNQEQDLKIIDFAIEKEKRRLAQEKFQRKVITPSNNNQKPTIAPLHKKDDLHLKHLDEKQALERKQQRQRDELEEVLKVNYDLSRHEKIRDELLEKIPSIYGKMTGQNQETIEALTVEEKNIGDINQRIGEIRAKLAKEQTDEKISLQENHNLELGIISPDKKYGELGRDYNPASRNSFASDRKASRTKKRGLDR